MSATEPNYRKHRINYALAATLLAQGLELPDVAQKVGAGSPESLRVGLNRKGVTVTATRVLQSVTGGTCSVAMRIATQASELLREDFAGILAKHTAALGEIKPRANLKHIKAVGDAMEPLARTAKIVHDWGNQSKEGMAMVGLWQEPAPQEPQGPVTDIQAVVVEPEKPSNPS